MLINLVTLIAKSDEVNATLQMCVYFLVLFFYSLTFRFIVLVPLFIHASYSWNFSYYRASCSFYSESLDIYSFSFSFSYSVFHIPHTLCSPVLPALSLIYIIPNPFNLPLSLSLSSHIHLATIRIPSSVLPYIPPSPFSSFSSRPYHLRNLLRSAQARHVSRIQGVRLGRVT